MERVIEPLTRMGATILTRGASHLPLAITGTRDLIPINYTLPVASAQVKSAILLAGLATPGKTSVVENVSSRDHTERMLHCFGADITVENHKSRGKIISINGQRELDATEIHIPADISSAAFLIAATLISPKGELLIKNVGINTLRSGILECIREMGGNIRLVGNNEMSGEPVADIYVQPSKLSSINVSAERAPSMIDEYPVLAVLAACASGTSHFKGLGELRHKESDRFSAIKNGLTKCGVNVMEKGDDLLIEGKPEGLLGGIEIESSLDHRIAMAFLVLGMVCRKGIAIDDIRPIKTSFPGFIDLMNNLGGKIRGGD
jgi:3-phosphoshikimate 1-carboxyvinyltransferase